METAQLIRESPTTAQERFEASAVGELAISVVIAVVLLIAVVWSMPESALRRKGIAILEPVAVISGLDQSWYVFAPDPFRQLETVEIRVETARGEHRVWTFPTGGALTQFTWYHWHKLKEQAVKTPAIRAGIVRWAAGQVLEPSDYPAKASMVLTIEPFAAPGSDTKPAAPSTEVLYAETLAEPS